VIKELVTYIGNNTSFTVGTNLFAISVDTDVADDCIVVGEQAPGVAHGVLTDYRQIPLVAYSRAANSRFTARDNAYTVFNLLHGLMQVNLPVVSGGDTYRCNFECRTPYYNGLDESGRRHEYIVSIDVTVTNIS